MRAPSSVPTPGPARSRRRHRSPRSSRRTCRRSRRRRGSSRAPRPRPSSGCAAFATTCHSSARSADNGLELVGQRALAVPVAVAVALPGGRPDVDVVDAPLVVFLAQDDAVAQAVLVPPQLGAVGGELIDLVVDPLADARDEALDLPGQALAAALGEHVEHAGDVAPSDRLGEHPDGIARLLGPRPAHQLVLEPPGLALALEPYELAVREADQRALADVGVALDAVFESLGLPGALLVALLPRNRELVIADLLASIRRQQRVGAVRV